MSLQKTCTQQSVSSDKTKEMNVVMGKLNDKVGMFKLVKKKKSPLPRPEKRSHKSRYRMDILPFVLLQPSGCIAWPVIR